MIGSLLAVLALAGVFAVAGPVIARRVAPALATRLLVPTSLIIAAASTFALGVAAFTLIGQVPEIAELGPWSPNTLRADTPVPAGAAFVGGLVLTYAAISALVLVSRRSLAMVGVHRTCGRLGAPGSDGTLGDVVIPPPYSMLPYEEFSRLEGAFNERYGDAVDAYFEGERRAVRVQTYQESA